MIHYSCDRCKRILDGDELRYVVRFEIQAMMLDGDDLEDDRDHLLELHEILERMDEDEGDFIGQDVYQKRRHDLCPECYRKFIKNPIGQEAPAPLGFSQN